MAKEIVEISQANMKATNYEVDVVKQWVPTDILPTKGKIIFKHDGSFYSMKREDFRKIFNE
jgi:hemin uptake protein HemP